MRFCAALLSIVLLTACGEDDPGFEACGEWPRSALPLGIVSDPTARDFVSDIKAGVAIWENVSPALLVYLGELEGASGSIVTVIATDDVSRGEAHTSIATETCQITDAQIFIPFSSRRLRRRVGHELGHVFRFKHDYDPDSIMSPDSASGGETVTPADRQRILDRYVR